MPSPTLKNKADLGRSLIVLGRKLRDGVDPEISDETLAALFSLAPNLPMPKDPKPGRQAKTDSIMELILEWVKNGEPIPKGTDHQAIQNALTKLRRNGQIINVGRVRKAKWRITTPEEQEQIANDVRERRREYDLNRAANPKDRTA
jgi:hypothetical protein